jgi:hypothetical protein
MIINHQLLLNIDYARLAREIVRLQAGPTSTNVEVLVTSRGLATGMADRMLLV